MAWYLELPNGGFVNKRGGIGTQQQADAFGSQAAAQAMEPYYQGRLGEKATAVNLGAPSAQTLDSPGYNPKLADQLCAVTAITGIATKTTNVNGAITGYSVI